MQTKVFNFVKDRLKEPGVTLDIGSFDVNGSLRHLFASYTGVDMREGPNVDIVANSHNLPFSDGYFDTVCCVETLEHDDRPFETAKEIFRVLKPGGYIYIAASGINFPKHSYPHDYFRYTGDGLAAVFHDFEVIEAFDDNDEAYLFAQKPN